MSKRALIVGGGRGVGAAIVTSLAEAGYAIDFTYRSAVAEAQALVASLPAADHRSLALDCADAAAVDAFAGTIEDTAYHAYIHAAGQPYDMLAAMIDQARAEAVMQVNVLSMMRIVKAVLRPMIRQRAGRIIGIGSVAALQANPGNAAYAATKGAMTSYLRTLAIETAKRGITVNTIAPGFVDTEMMAPYAGYREKIEKQIPIGRFAAPAEVAALVRFLLGPEAASITGATLPIDGGLTAALPIAR